MPETKVNEKVVDLTAYSQKLECNDKQLNLSIEDTPRIFPGGTYYKTITTISLHDVVKKRCSEMTESMTAGMMARMILELAKLCTGPLQTSRFSFKMYKGLIAFS